MVFHTKNRLIVQSSTIGPKGRFAETSGKFTPIESGLVRTATKPG